MRRQLLQIRSRLYETLDATGQYLRQHDLVADKFPRARSHLRERDSAALGEIEAALRRLNEGSYGWCCETGEPKGLHRLLARPTACLCTEAQERREHRFRLQPPHARDDHREEPIQAF